MATKTRGKCAITDCGRPADGYAGKTKVCGKHKQRWTRTGTFRARKYGVSDRASLARTALKELGRVARAKGAVLPRSKFQAQRLHALIRRSWVVATGDEVRLSAIGAKELEKAKRHEKGVELASKA